MRQGFFAAILLSVVSLASADDGRSLVDAVKDGDAAQVGALLGSGANPNSVGPDGQPPLYISADHGLVEIATLLLDHGADVNAVSPTSIESSVRVVPGKGGGFMTAPLDKPVRLAARDTPLIIAAWRGHIAMVKLLVEHGADVDAKGNLGWPPLLAAAKNGHTDIAAFLLTPEVGADIRGGVGEEALRIAIVNSNVPLAKALLAAGVNAKGAPGRVMPLFAALTTRPVPEGAVPGLPLSSDAPKVAFGPASAQPGRLAMIELLLNAGADPNDTTSGRPILHEAARQGDTNVVKLLLKKGADPDIPDNFGGTALQVAAREGHAGVVKALLDFGADVDRAPPGGFPPLIFASTQGHADVVDALLDRGAAVNGTSGTWIPLVAAAQRGQSEVVKALLRRGANANVLGSQGDSPLHSAASRGDLSLTEALLDHGANPNIKSASGQAPLHQIATTQHHEVAKLLLSRGARANEKDAHGKTPLHLVPNRGSIEVANVLLEGGADVIARDKFGNSPLFDASSLGRLDVATLLIAKGADVNATSRDGQTPLHVAAESGQDDVVALLLKHGAKVNATDKSGQTPLHVAYKEERRDVVKLLKDAGAKENVKDRMGKVPRDYGPEPAVPEYSLAEMVALEQTFDTIWKQMVASLKNGDGKGALRYIIAERRPKYERVFDDLVRGGERSDLERLFGDSFLHCFVPGDDWDAARKDWARSTYRSYWHRRYVICETVRTEHGTKYSYEIQFTRGPDDAWLISSF